MHPSDWAAWVQAVGSVIAILASVAIVLWQHRLQERAHRFRELRTTLDSVQAITLLIEQVIELADRNISTMLSGELISEIENDALVLSHATLRDMTNSEAPTADLIAGLIMARHGADHAFNAARILYSRLKFGNNPDGDPQALFDGALARLRKSLDTFKQKSSQIEAQLK